MSGTSASLRPWAVLPDRYADREVVATTIDARGRLVALLAPPGCAPPSRPGPGSAGDAVAVVIDGPDRTEITLTGLDRPFSLIDVVGDGFVLVDPYCRMPSGPAATTVAALDAEIPRNARIVGPDGATRTTFHVGTGIDHLLTDRAGNIWTGYGDEAAVCALQIGRRPGTQPFYRTVGSPGLIRWTDAGLPAWYATDAGFGPRQWDALNVGTARTCAGVPLVEIDADGVRCVRRSAVRSPAGILVAGDDLAFLTADRPYTPGHYSLTRARIVDGGPVEVTGVPPAPLLLPGGGRPSGWARGRICRDNRMWLRFDDPRTWYVVEI